MEIRIIDYKPEYEAGAEEMIREIKEEYKLVEAHKNYKPKLPEHYWLALHNDKVIGSVALLKEKNYAVLKRMFLLADYRGKEKGISAKLLSTALNWCKASNINTIYLGTIDVFKEAMVFYEKNGFVKIGETELPDDFPHNPIDKVFYKLQL